MAASDDDRVDEVLLRWQDVRGDALPDEAREAFTLTVEKSRFMPVEFTLVNDTPLVGGVVVEIMLAGASLDVATVGAELVGFVEGRIRDQNVADFRRRLEERREATMRRRKRGERAEVEGGDKTEDSWREFLRKPAKNIIVRLHKAREVPPSSGLQSGSAYQLWLSPSAAQALGEAVYPLAFRQDLLEGSKALRTRRIMACLQLSLCLAFLLFLLWAYLFFGALLRPKPHHPAVDIYARSWP